MIIYCKKTLLVNLLKGIDENLEKTSTEEIKKIDDQTNTMLDMFEFKLKYNIHPEQCKCI